MGQQLSTNTFGCAKWIVSSDATQGTHTTIASALTSASSGDTIFIRPGTYTENLTLKAGVNLASFISEGLTPNVTIIGKCSFSSAGTVSINGVRLQTNSDFCLAVTGSAASIVNLDYCYFNCTNNTGVSFTSSSASAAINITNYSGDIGTTGISFFSHSSAGILSIDYCRYIFTNTGASTTASTCSAGVLNMSNAILNFPLTLSGTGAGTYEGINVQTFATNTTCFTFGGSSGFLRNSTMTSGTASAISISTSAVIQNTVVSSTNANAITGAGTLSHANISFQGTSSTINPTITQIPLQVGKIYTSGISFDSGTNLLSTYKTGSWTPNLQINNSSAGITYTTQTGGYTQIGNQVTIWGQILLSSKGASVGVVTISNLPVSLGAGGSNQCISISFYNGFTAAGYSTLGLWTVASSTGAIFVTSGSGAVVAQVTNPLISNTFQVIFSGTYTTG